MKMNRKSRNAICLKINSIRIGKLQASFSVNFAKMAESEREMGKKSNILPVKTESTMKCTSETRKSTIFRHWHKHTQTQPDI